MPEVRLDCGCYAEWSGDTWLVTASSFLCLARDPELHRQGQTAVAPQPPEAIDGQLRLDDQAELPT